MINNFLCPSVLSFFASSLHFSSRKEVILFKKRQLIPRLVNCQSSSFGSTPSLKLCTSQIDCTIPFNLQRKCNQTLINIKLIKNRRKITKIVYICQQISALMYWTIWLEPSIVVNSLYNLYNLSSDLLRRRPLLQCPHPQRWNIFYINVLHLKLLVSRTQSIRRIESVFGKCTNCCIKNHVHLISVLWLSLNLLLAARFWKQFSCFWDFPLRSSQKSEKGQGIRNPQHWTKVLLFSIVPADNYYC